MINVKKMLLENRDLTARKGCLMAMIPQSYCEKINNFGKQIILDEDLYIEGNEYGRETEGHATIKYGFINDLNELEIRQLLKEQKQFIIEITELGRFDSDPKYDVAILKVKSPVLEKLNALSGIHLTECDYNQYTPHITLAYVQKGRFPHIKEGLNIRIPVDRICYSPIQGGKSYFQLEEGREEDIENIKRKIAELEKEIDRLDSTGQSTTLITQELERLRGLLPMTPERFNQIRKQIDEPPVNEVVEKKKLHVFPSNIDKMMLVIHNLLPNESIHFLNEEKTRFLTISKIDEKYRLFEIRMGSSFSVIKTQQIIPDKTIEEIKDYLIKSKVKVLNVRTYYYKNTDDLVESRLLKESHSPRDFIKLGMMQRSKPESVMVKVQHIMKGGVLNPIVEHGGDIMHRMNDPNTFYNAGYEYVKEKVGIVIWGLSQQYGFEKEFRENITNNKTDYKKLSEALLEYAEAHVKLPIFNRAQKIARDACVYLGNQKWAEALANFRELEKHLKTPIEWKAFAHEGLTR